MDPVANPNIGLIQIAAGKYPSTWDVKGRCSGAALNQLALDINRTSIHIPSVRAIEESQR